MLTKVNPVDRATISLRHSGVVSLRQLNIPIHIIGCGAIGSFVALGLGKLGASNLELWDADKVETHNIGNQFFPISSIGRLKVEAAQQMVSDFGGVVPIIHPYFFNAEEHASQLQGIVIMATDSMTTRKAIWESCKNKLNVELVIDARMGLGDIICVSVDPALSQDQKIYENSWYPDDKASSDPCTQQSIIYTVFDVTQEVIKRVKQYVNGEEYPKHIVKNVEKSDTIQIV